MAQLFSSCGASTGSSTAWSSLDTAAGCCEIVGSLVTNFHLELLICAPNELAVILNSMAAAVCAVSEKGVAGANPFAASSRYFSSDVIAATDGAVGSGKVDTIPHERSLTALSSWADIVRDVTTMPARLAAEANAVRARGMAARRGMLPAMRDQEAPRVKPSVDRTQLLSLQNTLCQLSSRIVESYVRIRVQMAVADAMTMESDQFYSRHVGGSLQQQSHDTSQSDRTAADTIDIIATAELHHGPSEDEQEPPEQLDHIACIALLHPEPLLALLGQLIDERTNTLRSAAAGGVGADQMVAYGSGYLPAAQALGIVHEELFILLNLLGRLLVSASRSFDDADASHAAPVSYQIPEAISQLSSSSSRAARAAPSPTASQDPVVGQRPKLDVLVVLSSAFIHVFSCLFTDRRLQCPVPLRRG